MWIHEYLPVVIYKYKTKYAVILVVDPAGFYPISVI